MPCDSILVGVFDGHLPGDVESTESATLDDESWMAGLSWIHKEYFVVKHIHIGTQKIQKDKPFSDEGVLINARAEASKVFIYKLKSASTGDDLRMGRNIYIYP